MQATLEPPTAPATPLTEAAARFAAEVQQIHRDAFQTLHKLMLHVADGLTKPAQEKEDPTQARTATQRLRLAIQAARDIIRYARVDEAFSLSSNSAGRRCPSPIEEGGFLLFFTRWELPLPEQLEPRRA